MSKDGVRSHFLPITFRVTPRQWTLTIFVTLMAMVGERVPPTAEDMADKSHARTRDTTQVAWCHVFSATTAFWTSVFPQSLAQSRTSGDATCVSNGVGW